VGLHGITDPGDAGETVFRKAEDFHGAGQKGVPGVRGNGPQGVQGKTAVEPAGIFNHQPVPVNLYGDGRRVGVDAVIPVNQRVEDDFPDGRGGVFGFVDSPARQRIDDGTDCVVPPDKPQGLLQHLGDGALDALVVDELFALISRRPHFRSVSTFFALFY
jgi:hypothetical protein